MRWSVLPMRPENACPDFCGVRLRRGMFPSLTHHLLALREEGQAIADPLSGAHQDVYAWSDMAILCSSTVSRGRLM